MARDELALARRNASALAYDIAYLRSTAKGLRNAARTLDRQAETKDMERIMDLLDRASKILSDPTLFHPTLF